MSHRRRFRPSSSWALEDRIALSHAGAAVDVAAVAARPRHLSATFQGKYTTSTQFGVDTVNSQTKLAGSSTIRGIGPVGLSGNVMNNGVFPSHFSQTQGMLTLSSKQRPGTLVLKLNGAYADLSPTGPKTISLTFTVTKATGAFTSENGSHGVAKLTLAPGRQAPGVLGQHHTSRGNFSLVLTQG